MAKRGKKEDNPCMELNAMKFALAGGILGILYAIFLTLIGMFGIPGFLEFAEMLVQFYGFWGYSISWLGLLIGAFYGFIEGFIALGLLAVIYNWLVEN